MLQNRNIFKSLKARGASDSDRIGEQLPLAGSNSRVWIHRLPVDFAHDFHALDYTPKGGKPLAIGVALSAEVESGLIADADEKFRAARRSQFASRQGNRSVLVADSGLCGALMPHGR